MPYTGKEEQKAGKKKVVKYHSKTQEQLAEVFRGHLRTVADHARNYDEWMATEDRDMQLSTKSKLNRVFDAAKIFVDTHGFPREIQYDQIDLMLILL